MAAGAKATAEVTTIAAMILFNIVFLLNYLHYQRVVSAPGGWSPSWAISRRLFAPVSPDSRWNGNQGERAKSGAASAGERERPRQRWRRREFLCFSRFWRLTAAGSNGRG